jgi:hypothetical protein
MTVARGGVSPRPRDICDRSNDNGGVARRPIVDDRGGRRLDFQRRIEQHQRRYG